MKTILDLGAKVMKMKTISDLDVEVMKMKTTSDGFDVYKPKIQGPGFHC
jgi:hypothetical protein